MKQVEALSRPMLYPSKNRPPHPVGLDGFSARGVMRRLLELLAGGNIRQRGALCCSAILLAMSGCDAAKEAAPHSVASVQLSASAATEVHSEENCTLDHSLDSATPRPARTHARALSSEGRARLTALRVSAHVGSVSLRKRGEAWIVSGKNECTVPPRRMQSALDQLSALKSLPTSERPQDGNSFELQIVALAGEERVLHLDVAGRGPEGDLVQLPDYGTFHVQGLDRELWSSRPQDWCAEP
jgi:hypothetical protein